MLRNISFIIIFTGLSTIVLQAEYVIQLGLYKNRAILEKMVDRISDPKLRSEVIIEKRGEMHWAHSPVIKDKLTMNHTLLGYRKVFKDAFFKEVPIIDDKQHEMKAIDSVKSAQKEVPQKMVATKAEEIDPLAFVQKLVPQKIEETKIPNKSDEEKAEEVKNDSKSLKRLSFEERLKGNVFFVCFETKDKQVVKTEFDGHNVSYTPVVGEMEPFNAQYDVVLDRIYIFKDKISTRSIYSTLDEVKEKYLLISSWHNRKKVNTIRYYYDLQDAMAYVKAD